MTVIVRVGADGAEYLLQDDDEGTWRIPSVRLRRDETEDAALRRLALSYDIRGARHEHLSERRYQGDAFDVANLPILVRTFFILVADSSTLATDEWTIWANSQDLARRRVHTDDLTTIAEMKRRVAL